MKPLRPPSALALLAAVQFACTTVYRPLDEPVTEDSLAAAIETVHASGARVEMLEDGLQGDMYRYEWRELENPPEMHPTGDFLWESMNQPRQRVRMLAGPHGNVYLPYSRIHSVEARSWPLWAGVEIQLTGSSGVDMVGPLVIEAGDAEEAARLSDAIACLGRARRLPRVPLAEASGPEADAPPLIHAP